MTLDHIDDSILDKEVTIKLSLRQLLQIGSLVQTVKIEGWDIKGDLYDRIIERLDNLKGRDAERFRKCITEVDGEILASDALLVEHWPDELEETT
jgi:hypothetical protein